MQFRLRTLFVVTILVAIFAGANVYLIESHRRSLHFMRFDEFEDNYELELTGHSTIVRFKPDAKISKDDWKLLSMFDGVRYFDDCSENLSLIFPIPTFRTMN